MENIWEIAVDTIGHNVTPVGIINDTTEWWNPLPVYNYWSATYPTTIYKYQITCPSCNKFNWLELDKITMCNTKKCGAKLKAVSQVADHEIAVSE